MTGLLALAFGAGMLAPVNPCGFAVLPAALAYTTSTDTAPGVVGRLAGGLRAGLALTVGFAGTVTAIGLLLAAGLRSLISVVPWLAAGLGALLAGLGLAMLAGRHLPLRLPFRRAGAPRRGPMRLVAFGAGYALASVSCTLAVLIAVVTQALATADLAGVLVVFAAYAAGSATLLLSLALFAAFASGLITRYLRRLLPHLNRISGALLAASGGYLLVYWLPQLTGRQAGTNALTRVAAIVSEWITHHQLAITVVAGGLVAATALAALVRRRHGSATSAGGRITNGVHRGSAGTVQAGQRGADPGGQQHR